MVGGLEGQKGGDEGGDLSESGDRQIAEGRHLPHRVPTKERRAHCLEQTASTSGYTKKKKKRRSNNAESPGRTVLRET